MNTQINIQILVASKNGDLFSILTFKHITCRLFGRLDQSALNWDSFIT